MIYTVALILEYALGLAVFIILFFIPAPYGRFGHTIHRFRIPARAGWFLMELPALLTVPAFCVYFKGWEIRPSAVLYLIFWLLHYGQRDLIYPWLLPRRATPMPIPVMLGGIAFNLLNGYVIGYGLFGLGKGLPLNDPRLYAGALLFLTGMGINIHSDQILRKLKRETGVGYSIPQKGFHRLVASPNYFGEIIEWTGWAIMTSTLGGVAFALFTFANLVPRAWKQRIWYLDTFGSAYPTGRKAIFPYIF